MNNNRRDQIVKIIGRIKPLRAWISELAIEEQEALDALPASLQETDQSASMEEAVNALEAALDSLEDVVGNLQDAQFAGCASKE